MFSSNIGNQQGTFGNTSFGFQNQSQNINQDGIVYVQNQNDIPLDSAQSIKFPFNSQNVFAVCSWDCTARLYQFQNNQIIQQRIARLPDFPLDCCFLQNEVLLIILNNNNFYSIKQNSDQGDNVHVNIPDQIFQLEFIYDLNIILAATQNQLLIFNIGNLSTPIKVFNFREKVIKFSCDLNDMIIAFSNDKFTIVEINSLNQMNDNDIPYFSSNLKSNIIQCQVFAKTKVFILGSCEGKCYRGSYDTVKMNFSGPNQPKKYTYQHKENEKDIYFVFVAQSSKNYNTTSVYQMNSIGNNQRGDGFLFTVGTNGDLNIWDVNKKNKIKQISLQDPICYATINQQGTLIAFAQGYDWHKGVNGLAEVQYKPKIGVKIINDQELSYTGNQL